MESAGRIDCKPASVTSLMATAARQYCLAFGGLDSGSRHVLRLQPEILPLGTWRRMRKPNTNRPLRLHRQRSQARQDNQRVVRQCSNQHAVQNHTTVPPTSTSTTTVPPATATVPVPTACPIQYADVLPGSEFYPYVRCLACRKVANGYPCGGPGEPCNANNDGYFRPFNNVTRGQIAKMVAISAGFGEDPGPQIFTDVPSTNAFYPYINRLTNRGHMGGYACGTIPSEPCDAQNRPYFRPFNQATRGQVSKIVANAAGLNDPIPAGTQTYTDVPPSQTFYVYIERLTALGVMGGYPCGGPGEPCDAQNRPYFRPICEHHTCSDCEDCC